MGDVLQSSLHSARSLADLGLQLASNLSSPVCSNFVSSCVLPSIPSKAIFPTAPNLLLSLTVDWH
jgi:hypothetical protein